MHFNTHSHTSAMYQTHKTQIDRVQGLIDLLDRKDRRRLLTLTHSVGVHKKELLDQIIPDARYLNSKRRTNDELAKEIICLYQKAGAIECDWIQHWEFNRLNQLRIRYSINKSNARPARQDNKDFINTGAAGSNANKIRYPKKVRKTAWKRFYKLFPYLKPKEEPISE